MKRNIIKIDEDKCTGCGLCVPGCHEEAIKIIDGKAKLVSDVFCDGLGACLGECPEGALTLEEKEANPFDEKMVQETIARKKREQAQGRGDKSAPQGLGVISPATHGCPGSAHAVFERKTPAVARSGAQQSELTHCLIFMKNF